MSCQASYKPNYKHFLHTVQQSGVLSQLAGWVSLSLSLPLSLTLAFCLSLSLFLTRPEVAELFKQLALISPAVTWSLPPSLSLSFPLWLQQRHQLRQRLRSQLRLRLRLRLPHWLRADGTSLATVARLKPVKCFYANFITFSCCRLVLLILRVSHRQGGSGRKRRWPA